MPERRFGSDWDLFRNRVNGVWIRAGLATDRVINEVKFRGVVSSESRRQASELAEEFGGEALAFLGDNLTQRLSCLRPTRDQVKVFQLLMNSVDGGRLRLRGTEGRLDAYGRPFVVKDYSVGSIERLSNQTRFARLIIRWGVKEPFPHGFGIFGFMGRSMPRSINFITFSRKPKTMADVQQVMVGERLRDRSRLRIGVFSNGERIVFNRDGVHQGEVVAVTNQYYLVGVFEGQGTGRTYWLYGSNSDIHSRMSTFGITEYQRLAGERVQD